VIILYAIVQTPDNEILIQLYSREINNFAGYKILKKDIESSYDAINEAARLSLDNKKTP
jgi:hypothetical protein